MCSWGQLSAVMTASCLPVPDGTLPIRGHSISFKLESGPGTSSNHYATTKVMLYKLWSTGLKRSDGFHFHSLRIQELCEEMMREHLESEPPHQLSASRCLS